MVKGDLAIQFVSQQLTSYSGLELVGRYLRRADILVPLRRALRGVRSDFGSTRLAVLIVALMLVGARRLEALGKIGDDSVRAVVGDRNF